MFGRLLWRLLRGNRGRLAVALVANSLAHLARTRAIEAERSHEDLRVLADNMSRLSDGPERSALQP